MAAVFFAVVIGYAVFVISKFWSFRSRLLNEFSSRGIPRGVADHIYAMRAEEINNLSFQRGMTASKIADFIISDMGLK